MQKRGNRDELIEVAFRIINGAERYAIVWQEEDEFHTIYTIHTEDVCPLDNLHMIFTLIRDILTQAECMQIASQDCINKAVMLPRDKSLVKDVKEIIRNAGNFMIVSAKDETSYTEIAFTIHDIVDLLPRAIEAMEVLIHEGLERRKRLVDEGGEERELDPGFVVKYLTEADNPNN